MIVDFHSHILPHVDHGSVSFEETKKQLDIVSEHGVDMIVATSHFYPNVHRVDEFLQAVHNASRKISLLSEHYKNTKIYLGAEVFLCNEMDKMPNLDKLCIRGTKCILIEMPPSGSWEHLIATLENMVNDGYTIVLAHIDRYIKKYGAELDRILNLGIMAQVNTDSLTCFFTRKGVIPYIEHDCVCALGSDLHGADKKAYKVFMDAKKNIGSEYYKKIMSISAKLLENAEPINI